MAELTLSTSEIPAKVSKTLSKVVSLTNGDKFKMELGEDELDVDIPDGEIWRVSLQIQVDVTEA